MFSLLKTIWKNAWIAFSLENQLLCNFFFYTKSAQMKQNPENLTRSSKIFANYNYGSV